MIHHRSVEFPEIPARSCAVLGYPRVSLQMHGGIDNSGPAGRDGRAFLSITALHNRQSDLGLGFLFFTWLSRIDFAEVNHVNCLVGRFKTGGRQWTVVDHSHMVGNS
jgi:hypothetical protein